MSFSKEKESFCFSAMGVEVTILGSWLKQFGFSHGAPVAIDVTKGLIQIKVIQIEEREGV